jgi:hypothetical protein
LHLQQTKNPGTLARGFLHADRDYAAAFFFLRHPSRPNPARPVAKSGRRQRVSKKLAARLLKVYAPFIKMV